MARIWVSALGSAGDVHPLVGLGCGLAARGHTVTVAANPLFAELVQSAGLEFFPVGTAEEFQTVIQDPDLWHPIRGVQRAIRFGVVATLRSLYEEITARQREAPLQLVAHPLDLASRLAHEKEAIPLVNVILAPVAFRSTHQPALLPGMPAGSWVPTWFHRFAAWGGDRLFVDRWLAPVNQFRRELGLAPVRRFFHGWIHRAQHVVALFPEWFAPPQPDWPSNVSCTGFPLWDERGFTPIPDGCRQFLEQGEPPIVWTPGSANAWGHDFFSVAADVTQRLGRRSIFLTRYPQQLPQRLPASIRHFDFVPFSQVLPQAAAVVHHGGVGSAAQGLAAGIPQLVRPLAFDQFDNAARLQRLGVAASLTTSRFRAAAVTRALDRLLKSNAAKQQALELADRLRRDNAVERACDLIEEVADANSAMATPS